jgi:hypothetical protein
LPRKIKLSEETRQWLKANHAQLTISELSRVLGCCDDTTKRILMRENLRFFSGAKFVISRSRTEQNAWRRPCLRCACTKPRPKNQYICDSCHAKMGTLP